MRSVIGATILLTVVSVLVLVFPGSKKVASPDVPGSSAASALEKLAGHQVSASARQMVGISGTIVSLNANQLILSLENGEQATLQTGGETVIVRSVTYQDGLASSEQVISATDLAIGDMVQVLAKSASGTSKSGIAQKIVLSQYYFSQ